MERPLGEDSAMAQQKDTSASKQEMKKKSGTQKPAATKAKKKSTPQAGPDTTGADSTRWGYDVDRKPEVQNPPGYRGMERPVNVLPPDSAKSDSGAAANATSRVNQMQRQDSISGREQQNPPGYRGMERPAGLEFQESADSAEENGRE
jgi:hypothetical protein